MSAATSALAGKPAPASILIDVPKLLAAYADLKPDPSVPAQRVAFGTFGHRGASLERSFNEHHILAITQAICDYRQRKGIDGPLFMGFDTHALSRPAFDTALEVLAANGVQLCISRGGEFTPTPAISHAILVHNRGRTSGGADGVVITPSHNPPDSGGFKYNPTNGGPAESDVSRWIENRANALLEGGLKSVKRLPLERARRTDGIAEHDFRDAYVADLGNIVDFDIIRSAGVHMAVDPLGGAGVHYWAPIAERYKIDLTVASEQAARFRAYGWHTIRVEDGNDLASIDAALNEACEQTDKPTLILVRTHIGYGSPEQDSFKAHGSALGADDVRKTKENLGWPTEPDFLVPDAALVHMRKAVERGARDEAAWNDRMRAYAEAFPDLAKQLRDSLEMKLAPGWDVDMPTFPADDKGMATRKASGQIMNALARRLPMLSGGSADLDPSTFTVLKGLGDFNPKPIPGEDEQGSDGGGWSYAGRNLHFGVREHAMAAIVNGMAAHGGFIPYACTFLIFSDYMRPSIRLAALMGLHVVHVFTHDSIALGEDGPTRQPKKFGSAEGLRNGAYVLSDSDHDSHGESNAPPPQLILIASDSEVGLIVAAAARLRGEGIAVRCVSMPSWDLFEACAVEERDAVLPPAVGARLAVEAGATLGWERYVGAHGDVLGIDHFGASAPAEKLLKEFGFTVDMVCARARALLK